MSVASPGSAPLACPICSAPDPMSYCRNESAHYFLCWSCGLIFRHPLPTSRFMAAWTDEKYASGAYHDYVSARPMKLRHFEERLDDLRTIIRAGTSWKWPPVADSTFTASSSRPVPLSLPRPKSGRAFSKASWRTCPKKVVRRCQRVQCHRARARPRAFPRQCARLLKPGGCVKTCYKILSADHLVN
jgi:hypothetical protein